MKDIEFNLLDEPWIRVMKPDCTVEEVSLTDALLHAHEYEDLVGELPTQDIAIMRVLLAVLHTVFSRVDVEGNPEPLDEDNALERWGELWELGAFPEKSIRDYLKQWHERFWLFHPERPFYQVPELNIGTEYSAKKLNGTISESDNKVRLFSSRDGNYKETLSFSESARWLINLNAYDDNSGKPVPRGANLPSCGVGWLGQLGLIMAVGNNLFETLLLNLVFLHNGKKLWEKDIPVWEYSSVHTDQRKEIAVPNNLAELFTLQSRRILLVRKDNLVTGFRSLGGDFFDRKNCYPYEPMTLWCYDKDNKGNNIGYKPYLHNFSKQIWRDFPAIVGNEDNSEISGIALWIKAVIDEYPQIRKRMMRFKMAGVVYGGGSQKSNIENVFSDFLSFHAGLLTESGRQWQERIKSELVSIDDIAKLVWKLASDLVKAAGGENQEFANRAKEQYYFRVNQPFRTWLENLTSGQNPEEMNYIQLKWRDKAKTIAKDLGRELVEESGPEAFSGRKIVDKNNKEYFYSAPEAFNAFINRLTHIYDSKGA